MIVGALRTVSRSGPDGHLNRWTLREATDRQREADSGLCTAVRWP